MESNAPTTVCLGPIGSSRLPLDYYTLTTDSVLPSILVQNPHDLSPSETLHASALSSPTFDCRAPLPMQNESQQVQSPRGGMHDMHRYWDVMALTVAGEGAHKQSTKHDHPFTS